MNEFDNIIAEGNMQKSAPTPQKDKEPFDSTKWAEQKQQTRKTAYDLIDTTAESVSRDSNKFRSYLDVQSRFDRYSIGNALLVMAQMPEAVQLKDYDAWKEAETPVKKKQKGINILEPGDEYTREDGTTGVSMNVKRVFDVSQTSSKERPTAVQFDDRTLLRALVYKAPVQIIPTEQFNAENANAYYDHTQKQILVRKGMEAPDIFKATTMELAHSAFAANAEEYSRRKENFKAQCVSYMLCKRYGIDTQDMEIRVPASYSGLTVQEVKGELSEIRNTTNDIAARMSKALEQSKSPKHKDQER